MKNGIRLFTMLLALAVVFGLAVSVSAAETVDSGICGENVTWTLADGGTLTISGSGQMNDYPYSSSAPWYGYRVSIKSIVIEDGVTGIGDYAFSGCSSLTSITIPEGMTSIGDRAFYECSSLTSITIPEGVTSIGDWAFYECSSLTSITIPEGVTSIGDRAFYECSSLTSITIPESVTSIGDSVFFGCSSLTYVKIPESVTSIGTTAFCNCSSLTSITIPESVTSIGGSVFFGCSSLTSITIPERVTSIGDGAFSNCSSLDGIWANQNSKFYISDGQGVLYNKDKTVLIAVPGAISGTYVIPASVTSIGSSAFEGCISLTSITIPDSVTSIGACAFKSCGNVTDITILEGVINIGDGAFAFCSSLTSIIIPKSVTSIGEYAFCSCSSLTSIIIPSGVTSIGHFTFEHCTSLISITIPDSMTSIGGTAFAGCSSLNGIWVDRNNQLYSNDNRGVLFNKDKTILIAAPGAISGTYDITNSVTIIGETAFHLCSSLTNVTISNSVVSIDWNAFSWCSNLTSITIPDSVKNIDDYAFYNCDNLTEITFAGDAPSFDDYVFADVTANAYYPVGNTTWTEDVMQDYGGTITWVPYNEEVAIPSLMLKYPSLSFESEINYNIYFTVSDAEVAVEDLGLITWYKKPASLAVATVDKAEYVIPGAVYNSARGEYMVKSQGIPAMRMGDDLYLRVYAKLADGTYAYSAVTYYSARDYAESILATSSNEDMKALCVAMLNYGAAAQQHFGHNTSNLMNAGLTDEQQALAADWSAEMMRDVITPDSAKTVNFISNGGFSGGYPSVSFNGAFAINYFFTAKQTPDTDILLYCWDEETYLAEDVLTEENAVRVLTMKDTGTSGKYMAAYSGIPAKDIGKTLFVAAVYQTDDVRYSSPVVAYSLGAYCQDRIDNGSETMKALAMQTAVYGHYAENCFAGING